MPKHQTCEPHPNEPRVGWILEGLRRAGRDDLADALDIREQPSLPDRHKRRFVETLGEVVRPVSRYYLARRLTLWPKAVDRDEYRSNLAFVLREFDDKLTDWEDVLHECPSCDLVARTAERIWAEVGLRCLGTGLVRPQSYCRDCR